MAVPIDTRPEAGNIGPAQDPSHTMTMTMMTSMMMMMMTTVTIMMKRMMMMRTMMLRQAISAQPGIHHT